MSDLRISDLFSMQKALQTAHLKDWGGLNPEIAPAQLLWMIEEVGEAISIIKKKGPTAILNEPGVRENFCVEIADVLMYLCDVLLCYEITPQEISAAYEKKHCYNMKRNYTAQYEQLYKRSQIEE